MHNFDIEGYNNYIQQLNNIKKPKYQTGCKVPMTVLILLLIGAFYIIT